MEKIIINLIVINGNRKRIKKNKINNKKKIRLQQP